MAHHPPPGLYAEFERYYVAHRCRYAPREPRRLFNLAFGSIYPSCRENISPWEFLGLMYHVLEGTNDCNGLFRGFDPERYHGQLPLEDHFKNMFASRLQHRVKDYLALASSRRRGDKRRLWEEFRSRPELGMFRGHESTVSPGRHAKLELALSLLDLLDEDIIRLYYWNCLSDRAIGQRVRMSDKTVKQRRLGGLEQLRRLLEESRPGLAL